MAKVTKESVQKMNNQLFNGFQVNVQKLLMNEKMAVKKVVLDEKRYLLASIWFGNEYENYRKVANTIELNVALYTKERSDSEVSVSHGLGYHQTLQTGLTRKEWKQIAKESQTIDEKKILDLYKTDEGVLKNGRIV